MQYAEQILDFLSSLQLRLQLPANVKVMNPYKDPVAWALCKQFYTKYYSDDRPRKVLLGINPGRFGGGITGIPFTDPLKLEQQCGIANSLQRKTELSSDFVYRVIDAFGGPEKFYRHFYISAVSPLGFTLDGKNFNYYDLSVFEKKLTPFIVQWLTTQLGFGIGRKICFCLGEGKNFKFLSRLNDQYHFFEEIVPLAHPRFIMQYRRKKLDHYVSDYISKLDP